MTTGPTDAQISKEYWKRQFTSLKHSLEENNPGMKPISPNAKPWQVIQDSAIQGAAAGAGQASYFQTLKAFQGNESAKQQPVISDPAGAKARIIETLIRQGKDAGYIEDVLNRVSPYLDIFGLTNDSAVQSILLSRLMNGSSGQNSFGLRDLVESIKLVENLRGSPQQPQDPATLMTATTSAIRTGAELAKSNNNGLDMTQILQMQQQSTDKLLQLQDKHHSQILELQQPRSLREQLTDIREMQDTLGKIAGKETPEIQMKRLDLLAQREQREFERSIEAGKEKRQSELIRGIGGAVGKALESPILREAGRKMAETVPGVAKVAGTVTQVQSSAARSTLDQPLEEVFSFKCGQCGTDHRFSRKALTLIESSPSRLWACPRCGASYALGQQGGPDAAEKKDNGSTGAF